MKRLFVLALLGVASLLHAQLALELKSSRSTYMLHEPVFLQLSIKNDAGQAMVFGDSNQLQGELFIEMTDTITTNSLIASRNTMTGKFPLYGCVIRAGETKQLILRFDDVMKFTKPGFYRLHAYIRHPMLKDAFRSNEVELELTNGAPYASYTVGVPKYVPTQGKIESRTYSLRTLIDLGQKYYYIVLSDSQNVYQVLRIGRDMGIEDPRCEVDMMSKLHVMIHISAKVVKHYVLDIDGTLVSCTYLRYGKTVPMLVRDREGKVFIAGGEAAVEGVDYQVVKSDLKPLGE